MFNLKYSIFLYITLILLFKSTSLFAQPESKVKSDLKKSLDFENWVGKSSDIRNGINLSKEKIPALSDVTEIKPKNLFFIVQKEDGEYFVQYRSKWTLIDHSFAEITISSLNSVEEAKEYLIDQFVSSTLPTGIMEKCRDISPIVGDVSFYQGRIFIRNNIVVKIHAEGDFIKRVKDIAKEIDLLFLAQKTLQAYNKVKPFIEKDSNGYQRIVEP